MVDEPFCGLTLDAVFSVNTLVPQRDSYLLQRPGFAVGVHPYRHGGTCSERAEQQIVGRRPCVAADGRRLVGDDLVPPRGDLLGESPRTGLGHDHRAIGRRGVSLLRCHATYCHWVTQDEIQWKDELVKVADRLEAKTKQTRWADRTGLLIERDFVVGAYALRKLVDSHDLSAELRRRHIPVRRYERIGKPPDPKDISESYDFENGRRSTLSVKDLCDEIMHSFAFTFFCGETADLFDGIYVSSDRRKDIYLVLASDFIALCSDMAAD